MLIRLSQPVAEASGQLAQQIVFYRYRGVDVVRDWVAPAQPRTQRQVLVRSVLTQASQSWMLTNSQQREAWKRWTETFQEQLRLAYGMRLSALAAFVKCNFYRLVTGLSVRLDAPTAPPPSPPTSAMVPVIDGTKAVIADVRHGISTVTGWRLSVRWGRAPTGGLAAPRNVLRWPTIEVGDSVPALKVTGGDYDFVLSSLILPLVQGERVSVELRLVSPEGVPGAGLVYAGVVTVI